jgi:hypothetical protein
MSMKRVMVLLVALMLGIGASAQSFDLEAVTGTSLNGSFRFGAGMDAVLSFHPWQIFEWGVGTGVRIGQPRESVTVKDGVSGNSYLNELNVPLFLRARLLLPRSFFVGTDIGYQLCLFSWQDGTLPKGGMVNPYFLSQYSGLFFEPHAGIRLGGHFALSLGAQLMRSFHNESNITSVAPDGTGGSVSGSGRVCWSPRLFLRLAYRF